MAAPLPFNEEERLRMLRRYSILDTPPEAAFDRLARLVGNLLNVPIALVSLVDSDRQWFKAAYGLTAQQTPRDVSFCAHAILLDDDVFEVPNALMDDRFIDNALVTGEPHIRFYAGVPLRGADGSKLGTLCALDTVPRKLTPQESVILQDLADMAMDELRLRLAVLEKNQLFEAIRHANNGVLITDPNLPDHPIIFCNDAFTTISGYQRSEAIGRNCRFLQGAETDPGSVSEMLRAISERGIFSDTILNYRKDGSIFWNELTLSPVMDQEGKLVNYVGVQNDVTLQKTSEHAMRESYQRLREAEALRDDLTSMMVHDMRSPLTVALGFLEMLEEDLEGKLDEAGTESFRYILNSVEQLNNMTTSLLDVSRLEAGEMPLRLEAHDLGAVARRALNNLQGLHGAGLQLRLPEAELPVRCDEQVLERVIVNLVSNALKFSPENEAVVVEASEDNGSCRFSVTDLGMGIAPEMQEKIFEKFAQVGERQRVASSGLGLTFCKLAVEAQGGQIGVESRPGAGSKFWFALPGQG
jgi:PAS domain S-box-containing protein